MQINIDLAVAGAVTLVYATLVLVLLPSTEYLRALGGAVLALAAVFGTARALGRGPVKGIGIFFVIVASSLVLWLPTFPALGGKIRPAIPLGFLGVQAVTLVWAALRWPKTSPPGSSVSISRAWMLGAIGAVALGVVATIPLGLSLLSGHRDLNVLWVYPAYFVGAIGAATAFWMLQRVSHLATGCYLIGALGGLCFYGAIAPVVYLLQHEAFNPSVMLLIATIAGFVVGPAVSLDVATS